MQDSLRKLLGLDQDTTVPMLPEQDMEDELINEQAKAIEPVETPENLEAPITPEEIAVAQANNTVEAENAPNEEIDRQIASEMESLPEEKPKNTQEQLLEELRKLQESRREDITSARDEDDRQRIYQAMIGAIPNLYSGAAAQKSGVFTAPSKIKQLEPLKEKRTKEDYKTEYENMLAQYRAMIGGDTANWRLVTLEDPDTGAPVTYRINPATGAKEAVGTRGFSTRLVKDPITGELIDPRKRLRTDKQEEDAKESKVGKGIFKDLTPNQRKEYNELRKSFDTETKDERASMDKIEGLSTKLAEEALTNPIAASALGAQVASIYESGRLTDEDVARYTRRQGISDRVADTLMNLRKGVITVDKAEDIKQALEVLKQTLETQISGRAMEKAKVMEEIYGIDAQKLVKGIYSNYKKPEEPKMSEKVAVQLPNGQKGRIDRNKLDAFKKKYPKAKILE